jgi:lysophospholipase L1-like esterase
MLDNDIKIFLAADSTVQNYEASSAPQAGWGQFISNYFTDNVQFVNRAIGGRSSKSFVVEGRLDLIIDEIREGDYLFIQMGHNDSTIEKPERYTEPYSEYKNYLKMYVEGARKKNATPILITPVGRLNYSEGIFAKDFSDYCTAMKQVAEEEKVKLIDLMTESVEYLSSIGYEEAYKLFMVSVNGTDHTHLTEKGADQIAKIVSREIKKLDIKISQYVK